MSRVYCGNMLVLVVEKCCASFVSNSVLCPAVTEFWKLANIWQSYWICLAAPFHMGFFTQCTWNAVLGPDARCIFLKWFSSSHVYIPTSSPWGGARKLATLASVSLCYIEFEQWKINLHKNTCTFWPPSLWWLLLISCQLLQTEQWLAIFSIVRNQYTKILHPRFLHMSIIN